MEYHHIPVMPQEIIEELQPKEGGIYVDCTLGGGGHTKLIAERIGEKGKVIGIDQDEEAIKASKNNLAKFGKRIIYINDNFKNLDSILDESHLSKVNGILLDLGVSSFQLENLERGFSFKKQDDKASPRLDMRMNRRQVLDAYYVVNEYPERELRDILQNLGEEPFARKIAKRIVEERRAKPIATVNELLEVIRKATPPSYRYSRKKHYASKVFRAVRMEVNQELPALKKVIPQAILRLRKGGRLVIISFHSLEDRIVKNYFREAFQKGEVKILTKKPLIPTPEEVIVNPKARSAKLRVVEKN